MKFTIKLTKNRLKNEVQQDGKITFEDLSWNRVGCQTSVKEQVVRNRDEQLLNLRCGAEYLNIRVRGLKQGMGANAV